MSTTSQPRTIPQSLRSLQRWFVTGQTEWAEGHLGRMRYSARTLAELDWHSPNDFTDFDEAFEAANQNFWLDGIGLRIEMPYFALIVANCFDEHGKLERWLRIPAGKIGGYWAVSPNRRDVLAVLRYRNRMEPGLSHYHGHLTYIHTDALCDMTGEAVPGLAGEPDVKDEHAFGSFWWRNKMNSAVLPGILHR